LAASADDAIGLFCLWVCALGIEWNPCNATRKVSNMRGGSKVGCRGWEGPEISISCIGAEWARSVRLPGPVLGVAALTR